MEVLQEQRTHCGRNKGFRMKNGRMYKYELFRQSLLYLYIKRVVHNCGVKTSPLEDFPQDCAQQEGTGAGAGNTVAVVKR